VKIQCLLYTSELCFIVLAHQQQLIDKRMSDVIIINLPSMNYLV
jgi:hypothetical protein